LKDLESEDLEFLSVEDFITKLRKEFGEGDNELVKVAELKKVK